MKTKRKTKHQKKWRMRWWRWSPTSRSWLSPTARGSKVQPLAPVTENASYRCPEIFLGPIPRTYFLVCPQMAWLGFLKLFYLLFEHARTPFQPVLGPIACFVTPIPAERAKKQMNRQFPANQFESRPPAWQASALSIAPLPLWLQVLEIIDRLPAGFVSPKSKPGWGAH